MESENSHQPEHSYSPEFQEFLINGPKLKELLEGSRFSFDPWDKDEAWEAWEQRRKFVADAIKNDGTILDYGCANGFFLRCLQEWSPHKLDPYGFDIDPDIIAKAKELFNNTPDHFADKSEFEKLPKKYDTVYWNVWGNFDFSHPEAPKFIENITSFVNNRGRLIMGFYEKKEDNYKLIDGIKRTGIRITGISENPAGEVIAYIDYD